ncbi:NB-ARC domain-containing protein, partial [Kibdelosporangium lantanae]
MADSRQALHRTIVVVDVEGFGSPARTLPHQLGIRAGLYRVVEEALRAAGVAWERCRIEDRGDAVFILVPADIPKGPIVEVAPEALVRALRAHNHTADGRQRLRLRMAVHAGEVALDDYGATSTAINTAFRLVDAPPLKQALRDSPGVLALIVSRWVFDEVVRHSTVLDSATFRPTPIAVKETQDTAWIALPDHPYTTGPAVLNLPAEHIITSDHPAPAPVVPRQLPPAPAPFVGRTDELADLDRAIRAMTASTNGSPDTGTDPVQGNGATLLISALGGAGGIGKTWLALTWAHRNAHRFPDGQLFVDLRGFSPDGTPLTPLTAVHGFLVALGVTSARIPADLDARTALYRSTIADKRMLIVLDNAATTDQVEPLLPGTATCTVLITCRKKLATLITRYGARHLQLNILTHDEAHALLTKRLGPARVSAEPNAADELIRLCGRYTLALAIMAQNAHTRPHIPLAEFTAELRDLGLDALDNDDPAASLANVLSWSLRGLTIEQRTVFALLGIAPGPDIGLPAAISLTDLPARHIIQALNALEEASLVARQPNHRYAMHDVIRHYAATLAHQHLGEGLRETALRRVLDFYTHTAHAADRLLDPHNPFIRLDPPAPEPYPHLLPDAPAAMAWFDTERANLLAAQHTAVTHGWHHTVWKLAWTLDTFHNRRGHRHDQLAMRQAALDAVAHLPDRTARIR